MEPAAIERAVGVLAGVVGDLRGAGVALGIETGYHAWELPTAGGMRRLLEGVELAESRAVVGDAAVVGAWLDTGHVGVQENVGTATFEGWFGAVAGVGARWVGVHWHDVVGVRDHLAVGTGTVAGPLLGAVERRPVAASAWAGRSETCEFDHYLTDSEIAEGARLVVGAGNA